jgi:hypothetical protein
MRLQICAGVLTLSAALSAANPARPASLVIDDTVADPNIKFSVNGFANTGFGVNDAGGNHVIGAPSGSGSVTVSENGVGVAGAQEITFSGQFLLGGQTLTPKNETVFLTEGNGPDISDVIEYDYTVIQQTEVGEVSGFLLSDTGTPFTVAQLNAIGIVADRTVSESEPFSFSAANIASTFTSDVDLGPGVPELPAWGMMLLSFAALGLAAFRRSAKMRLVTD